ncbi:GNAT family N-acetyltransferase [Pareuzebyella sediminis]|uniref:GNAT family N-acetyltransferase n=1 Tax=Pareuzebyella sediminis TaxID=2607998 RepID=UPI0011EE908E|nr:GNAT family N-acetyltransferase [Pareuzebyella sediminis]
MVTIKEVGSKSQLREFVKFPFEVYKKSANWVPPIIADEMASFDKENNPAFKTARAWLFLAYSNGKIVGRVVAIINTLELERQNIKKMRFGWCDFIDDPEVSKSLMNKVIEMAQTHKMDHIEGPMGFSNLDKVGVLTEGFDSLGTMVTWYNHPYYAAHFEALGFKKEKEYFENTMPTSDADPSFFLRINKLVKKRFSLKEVNVSSKAELLEYVDPMFDLLDLTYAKLASYAPISPAQRDYIKKRFINFVDPEFIKFVVDENDRLIAFAVVLPSFARALQKAKGKLFPFGWYHLWRAKNRKKVDRAIFYLIGVHPDYQNKGVTAIIFNQYYETFTKRGVKTGIRTPELSDNLAARQIWKHVQPTVHKKRCTFRMDLQ